MLASRRLLPPCRRITTNSSVASRRRRQPPPPALVDPTLPLTPKDPHGRPLSCPEYLSLTSLSPWVPCPDMVVRRGLEIARASPQDLHVDLGCGDGRWNFAAVDPPFGVTYSCGIDIDSNVLEHCRIRKERRFVPRGGEPNVEFLQADLKEAWERERERYWERKNKRDKLENSQGCSILDPVSQKLANATIVTLYFVPQTLVQIKPYLTSIFFTQKRKRETHWENARVISVGYEIQGWEPDWAEQVMGLTIFRYDMKRVIQAETERNSIHHGNKEMDDDIPEWNEKNESEEKEVREMNNVGLDSFFPASILTEEYIQQKRITDMEELDSGLRIHHDPALDNLFSPVRTLREPALSSEDPVEKSENEEDHWDFDEEEEER